MNTVSVILIHTGVGIVMLVPLPVQASLTLSLDADARVTGDVTANHSADLHAAGFLVRKSIADTQGDRFILTMLAESYNTFNELMLHEASLRIKGPMSRWNITTGRFTLPYGLLQSFSTARYLFSTWYDDHLGFDVDNGILVSGINGDVDYGIAYTQGRGPHHRFYFDNSYLISGRIGYTLGDAGDYMAGISLLHGTIAGMHSTSTRHRLSGLGLDGTLFSGPLTIRGSLDGGVKDRQYVLLGYSYIQYGVHRTLDLDLGCKYGKNVDETASGILYAGCTVRNRFLTLRGGYWYDSSNTHTHNVSIQLYRLFSTVF